MIIYVDVLIFLNSIVTYFLLLAVCAVFKSRPKTYRLIFGAVFGGFSALAIFLPDLGAILELIIRITICAFTVLITFSFKNKIRFLKLSLSFLTITYIFAGAMLAVWGIFKPKSMAFANGITYFDISPIILIILTALVYLFIKLLMIFKQNTKSEELIFDCIIKLNQYSVSFQAINDTGNSLCDPYFGSPVAVVEHEILIPLLKQNPKTYLIPVKSITGSEMLYSFRPTEFFILKNNKKQKIKDITVAISKTKIHNQFGGILPSKIIDLTEEQACL